MPRRATPAADDAPANPRRATVRPGASRGEGADGGGMALGLAPALVAAVMVAVAILDVAGYLVAASAAQTAADGAALAAVSSLAGDGGMPAALPAGPVGSGEPAAREVAEASGARLERCDCRSLPVEVVASLPVRGLVLPRVAGRRVHATARADLTRPGSWSPGRNIISPVATWTRTPHLRRRMGWR